MNNKLGSCCLVTLMAVPLQGSNQRSLGPAEHLGFATSPQQGWSVLQLPLLCPQNTPRAPKTHPEAHPCQALCAPGLPRAGLQLHMLGAQGLVGALGAVQGRAHSQAWMGMGTADAEKNCPEELKAFCVPLSRGLSLELFAFSRCCAGAEWFCCCPHSFPSAQLCAERPSSAFLHIPRLEKLPPLP